MSLEDDVKRLRAYAEVMVEFGMTELVYAGVSIQRPGNVPSAIEKPRTLSRGEELEKAALEEEKRELAAMGLEERRHYEHWNRICRSSGAPIPPFKPKKDVAA